jgi:hypothetical protein
MWGKRGGSFKGRGVLGGVRGDWGDGVICEVVREVMEEVGDDPILWVPPIGTKREKR